MPPKPKFTREMILDTALEMVRSKGWASLSTRNIAKRLNSSIGPIYSFLKSMQTVEVELIRKVYEMLHESLTTPRTGDQILDMGVGYVVFARDEKQLFKCLVDEKYAAMRKPFGEQLWRWSSQKCIDDELYDGLTREEIIEHRKKMVVFSHGLAVMINSDVVSDWLSDQEIETIIQENGEMLLAGPRAMKRGAGNLAKERGEV